jgi:hypothetical protein
MNNEVKKHLLQDYNVSEKYTDLLMNNYYDVIKSWNLSEKSIAYNLICLYSMTNNIANLYVQGQEKMKGYAFD